MIVKSQPKVTACSGIGLVATERMTRGEVVLRVPLNKKEEEEEGFLEEEKEEENFWGLQVG